MGGKSLDPKKSRYMRDYLAWRTGYIEWVFNNPSIDGAVQAAEFMGISAAYLYTLCRESGLDVSKLVKKKRKKPKKAKKKAS